MGRTHSLSSRKSRASATRRRESKICQCPWPRSTKILIAAASACQQGHTRFGTRHAAAVTVGPLPWHACAARSLIKQLAHARRGSLSGCRWPFWRPQSWARSSAKKGGFSVTVLPDMQKLHAEGYLVSFRRRSRHMRRRRRHMRRRRRRLGPAGSFRPAGSIFPGAYFSVRPPYFPEIFLRKYLVFLQIYCI